MSANKGSTMSEYQLREAAGKYWLLHMEQQGVPYESPLSFNLVGAEIWKALLAGEPKNAIIEKLSIQYKVSMEEMKEDVLAFCKQLETYGIKIEE